MAHNIIPFSKSSYYRLHRGVDRYLLEHCLFPGLEEQGKLGRGSQGIELPSGTNQASEYISLDEAKQLVLSWLVDTDNLLESDRRKLERFGSYEKFAYAAYDLYQAKVEDPAKLVTATRIENVLALRAAKQTEVVNTQAHFDPGKIIEAYNAQYLNFLSHSQTPNPQHILDQLLTPGVIAGSGISRQELISTISENLPRLYRAGSYGTSPRARDNAVVSELAEIISTSHPKLVNYLNYLGDAQTANQIHNLTNTVAENALAQNPRALTEFESIQNQIAPALDYYLLNESELRSQIYSRLDQFSEADRRQFTDAILRETIRSSTDPVSFPEIINQVATRYKLKVEEKDSINRKLIGSGLEVSLEYRETELNLLLRSRHLTRGELNLLNKGINPFLATDSQLLPKASKLLASYNSNTGTSFKSLSEAYTHEVTQEKPNLTFLNQARSHLNRTEYYQSLNPSDITLLNRTKFGRWVANTQSRFYEMQAGFFDKWVDIEETITGKKWLYQQLDNWDKFAEHFTVKIGKAQIPLFRIVPWIQDRIDEWKQKTTRSLLLRTEKSTSIFGKLLHWNLEQFELGGFTVSGATGVVAYGLWSKGIYWASGRIVKEGIVFSARTATRFLIKLGGKNLARAGEKAVAGLVAAGTAIGSALGVVFAVGMVIDLVKAGWEFVKNFFTNADFRGSVAKAGLTIAGIFLAIPTALAGLATTFGLMVVAVLPNVLLSMIIMGGMIFFNNINQTSFITSIHLDSANITLNPSAVFGEVVDGNGCVQAIPAHGAILQGPHGTYSHNVIVAIDIQTKDGDPVYSASPGKVVFAGYKDVYGNRIDIQSTFMGKTVTFIYGHLQSINVNNGQEVGAGQVIGKADSTSSNAYFRNPHLHFEISGAGDYASCPVPGTNPTTLEGCADGGSCNATI